MRRIARFLTLSISFLRILGMDFTPNEDSGDFLNGKGRNVRSISKDLEFCLYARGLGKDGIVMMDSSTTKTLPEYNAQVPTKIIVHGFFSSESAKWVISIRRSYVKKGLNVITMDWSPRTQMFKSGRVKRGGNGTRHSSNVEDDVLYSVIFEKNGTARRDVARSYSSAASDSMLAGQHLAKLIDNLVKGFGVRLEDLHLIGHSLGAHVCGVAGSHVKSGKVGRITGLDPADPHFTGFPENKRLDKNDAVFVDVIHTDTVQNLAGYLMASKHFGYRNPCGHADFYPNGGGNMPECSFMSISCFHSQAHKYFLASIKKPYLYPAYMCRSLDGEIQNTVTGGGNCNQCCDKCPEPGAFMGDAASPNNTGLFYAYTVENDKPKCGDGRRRFKSVLRSLPANTTTNGATSRIKYIETMWKLNVLTHFFIIQCPCVILFGLLVLLFI